MSVKQIVIVSVAIIVIGGAMFFGFVQSSLERVTAELSKPEQNTPIPTFFSSRGSGGRVSDSCTSGNC